jgi:hypothetical protein
MEISKKNSKRNIKNSAYLYKPVKIINHKRYITLYFTSIEYFFKKNTKKDNDSTNKIRENIIFAIANNKIPDEYLKNSKDWENFSNEFSNIKKKLLKKAQKKFSKNKKKRNKNIIFKECILKGGRKYNYDFDFVYINKDTKEEHILKIEFKNNTTEIENAPQFYSPTKPSDYFYKSFEAFWFDNYLPIIVEEGNKINKHKKLMLPDKDEYIKKINNNNVDCMEKFKEMYKEDKKFNKLCKKEDKKGIKKFINSSDLNINKLSNKLCETQKDKIYLCFKDGEFHIREMSKEIYKIKEVTSKINTCYICKTEKGQSLEVRLRFKNGCGINFPALQIKRKIPTVKQLKELCKTNNIYFKSKVKKAELLSILDDNAICY